MDKLKVVFLGTKKIGYACFQYLIQQSDALNIEIIGLFTKENTTLGNGISLTNLAIQNAITDYHSLDSLPECDILYSVQYHEILKQKHIDKAKIIALNLHMAPLPEYRGCNQFSFAIIDNKKEFGTTIHQMQTGIDDGDMLFEKRFAIPENCWVNDLYELTYKHTLSLFQETLKDIISSKYELKPQSLFIESRGTSMHYRNEMDALKIIDTTWDEEIKHRYIRATSMPGFEMPYSIVDGEKLYYDTSFNLINNTLSCEKK
jgi:methionyl-tRNA formyltransferase